MSLDNPVDVVDGSILHIPMEGMIVEERLRIKISETFFSNLIPFKLIFNGKCN